MPAGCSTIWRAPNGATSRELRATLLLAVVGTVRSFWWQVGDGAVVVRTDAGLKALGEANKTKGEFANQTCFVDTANPADMQFGLLPTADIFGRP